MDALDLISWIGIIGVVVFAASGASSASRHHMDPIGFIFLGMVTAIGGGTLRDVFLDQPVFWTSTPSKLVYALVTAVVIFFYSPPDLSRDKWVAWFDAAGLAAFTVQGCFTTLFLGNHHPAVVIVMGVLTATGGGILRDLLAGDEPMIFSGQLYASTALLGSVSITLLSMADVSNGISAICGFLIVFLTRAVAIIFNIHIGSGPFRRKS